jgi:hypothetical protein
MDSFGSLSKQIRAEQAQRAAQAEMLVAAIVAGVAFTDTIPVGVHVVQTDDDWMRYSMTAVTASIRERANSSRYKFQLQPIELKTDPGAADGVLAIADAGQNMKLPFMLGPALSSVTVVRAEPHNCYRINELESII